MLQFKVNYVLSRVTNISELSMFKWFRVQGPVVQSIVSLTSSLRGQLFKSFTTL